VAVRSVELMYFTEAEPTKLALSVAGGFVEDVSPDTRARRARPTARRYWRRISHCWC